MDLTQIAILAWTQRFVTQLRRTIQAHCMACLSLSAAFLSHYQWWLHFGKYCPMNRARQHWDLCAGGNPHLSNIHFFLCLVAFMLASITTQTWEAEYPQQWQAEEICRCLLSWQTFWQVRMYCSLEKGLPCLTQFLSWGATLKVFYLLMLANFFVLDLLTVILSATSILCCLLLPLFAY